MNPDHRLNPPEERLKFTDWTVKCPECGRIWDTQGLNVELCPYCKDEGLLECECGLIINNESSKYFEQGMCDDCGADTYGGVL